MLVTLGSQGTPAVVEAEGYFPVRRILFEGRPSDVRERIQLQARTTVAGTLVDARSGAPIPGTMLASNRWRQTPPLERPSVAVRVDGSFTGLEVFAKRPTLVWAVAAGYPTQSLEIAPGTERVELALDGGVPLSGRVVDFTTGVPVADGIVPYAE